MLPSERALAMEVEAKHDTLCIKKVLRSSIRISCRCASKHWVIFSLVLLLYLLYKSSPGFFAFILSCSPTIICATLLLGLLLSYGSTHLPETDVIGKPTTYVSAPKFGSVSGNAHLEAHQEFSVHAFNENTTNFKRWELKNTSFSKVEANAHVELGDSVPLMMGADQGDEKFDAHGRIEQALICTPSMIKLDQEICVEEFIKANHEQYSKDPFTRKDEGNKYANLFEDAHQSRVDGKETTLGLCSSSENDKEDGETVVKENQDRVLTNLQSGEVRGVSEDMITEKPAGTCRWGRAFSMRQRKKLDNIKIEAINTAVGNKSDSSLGSPLDGVVSHDDLSCFGSDKAESSSFDTSMTDVSPVLHDIDPISRDEFPSPDPIGNDDVGSDSKLCPQNSQVNKDSDAEADIIKAENGGKDGEKGEEDESKQPALLWLADNEKNVMDVGYCEMERNRRLEILMVKRRSSKNIIFDVDKNLEFDGNDVCRSADGSRCPIQVRPISAPRRNPFNLSSDSDEAGIPGSAPSVMHRRENPFETPFGKSNDAGVPAHDNLDRQEFVTGSHRDMLFRRHGTFNFGSQDRRLSRFKPCFLLEAMDVEEASTSNFQRQFSDRSMSRLSNITESDTISSVVDLEDISDFIKKDFVWDLQRQFSDKSISKLSVVTESDAVSSVADHEDRNDPIPKDFLWYFQRQFSDKSVAKLSIVAESDAVSFVADQEEHNELVNKDLVWRHGSADLLRQESDLGYAGSECSDMIKLVDDETLNAAVTTVPVSETVGNTAPLNSSTQLSQLNIHHRPIKALVWKKAFKPFVSLDSKDFVMQEQRNHLEPLLS